MMPRGAVQRYERIEESRRRRQPFPLWVLVAKHGWRLRSRMRHRLLDRRLRVMERKRPRFAV